MKIRYKKGYKYQLDAEYVHEIPELEEYQATTDWIELRGVILAIKRGYAWDGPSGPTIDWKCSLRASLIHDALYQLIRLNRLPFSLRGLADSVFYDVLVEDGMWPFWARRWRGAVQKFGDKHVSSKKAVLSAP